MNFTGAVVALLSLFSVGDHFECEEIESRLELISSGYAFEGEYFSPWYEVSVPEENAFTSGYVETFVRVNPIFALEPDYYDLCEWTECPMLPGTINVTNSIEWYLSHDVPFVYTTRWYDEEGNDLLCNRIIVNETGQML